MLLQVPLMLRFQWAVGALVNNVLMLRLTVLLDVPNLGIFVVAEVALVLQSFVLIVNVPFQGTLVDGDKIAVFAGEPDPSVDRLNVLEEGTLGSHDKCTLLTGKTTIGICFCLACYPTAPWSLNAVAHRRWRRWDHNHLFLFHFIEHVLIYV